MTHPLLALGIDDPRRRGRFRQPAMVLGAALVVTGVGSLVVARSRAEVPRWQTAFVSRGDFVATATATGSLRPHRTVEVGAEVGGTVKAVHVEPNDPVHVGDVLVEIDTSSHAATLAQGRASVLEATAAVRLARVDLAEARRHLQRTNRFARAGHVPQQEVEEARTLVARARAALAGANARERFARAALRGATTNLERAVIRSPIDGIVLARNVEPGQTLATTLQAPTVVVLAEDLTRMELHVDVDEADVGQVHEGMEATFTVDAYADRRFRGQITRVAFAGRLVQNVVSYETVIAVDNSDLALRPGMTANATIVTERRSDVLLVPNAALRFSPRTTLAGARDRRWDAPQGPTLWTVSGGQPEPLRVETLGSDDTRTQVRGSIREGLEVIVGVYEEPQ